VGFHRPGGDSLFVFFSNQIDVVDYFLLSVVKNFWFCPFFCAPLLRSETWEKGLYQLGNISADLNTLGME
jgi:hypothetical protein